MIDFQSVRNDFPILSSQVHGHPLIYLDNAATTQLPRCVLQSVREHYEKYNSNVHRGIHYLSEQSTSHFEAARAAVCRFLGANSCREIVFTSGTTDSINLVARGFQERFLFPGDEVITTEMEHHANLIPWQEACRRSGAVLRVIPLSETGDLDLDSFHAMLSPRTRLVAVAAVSNVLGTVNPLEPIIEAAHRVGAAVLVDAAQAMRHLRFDVQALDCDFLCFSGHKVMAPAGIGVLYGKEEWLDKLPPVSFGGGIVEHVSQFEAAYTALPQRLEAGTPNYPGAIGLAAALDYLSGLGLEAVARQEDLLLQAYETMLRQFPRIHILGEPARRAGVLSFTVKDFSPYDVSMLLDKLGVATRSGQHCAQPLLERLGTAYAARISPAFYNQLEEVPAVQAALERTLSVLEAAK
ncbi:MAG: aminotransferase class V-fold PLP-dependent enzyme [Oscillospiraceae bacterium]